MQIAIVCLDEEYIQNATFMANALVNYTPITDAKIVTQSNPDQNFSDRDFFFVWNKIDVSIPNIANLTNKFVLETATMKCSHCGYRFENDAAYTSYKIKGELCPSCNKPSVRKSNFIYIFTGSHLRYNADDLFKGQLRTRFWASVDADWSLFRCLVQSVTMIPHVMVMPQRSWKKPSKYTVSHFPTPDEPRSCIALETIKRICSKRGYVFNENPAEIYKTDFYIDQIYTGIPSQYAINAMSLGIPTMVNLSKFYLSHYPQFPAINISAENIIEKFTNLSERVKRSDITRNYVNKWFNPQRVATQWYNLAKFILSPNVFLDERPELDNNPLPLYWAYQGGYPYYGG